MLSDTLTFLSGGKVSNFSVESGSSFPPAQIGELFFLTTTNTLYFYNGSAWKEVTGDAKSVSKYNITGVMSINTGTMRWYPDRNITLSKVYFSMGTSPTSNVVIDVKKNGSSIFSGSYPTCSSGNYLSSSVSISTPMSPTDYLTVDVTAGTTGSDAVIFIVYS